MELDQILATGAGALSGLLLYPAYHWGFLAGHGRASENWSTASGLVYTFVGTLVALIAIAGATIIPPLLVGVFPLGPLTPTFLWAWITGAVVYLFLTKLIGRTKGDV